VNGSERSGLDVVYEWRPAQDTPSRTGGVPVVLIHAFPLDSSMWSEVLADLAVLDVVLMDLPGLGTSAQPEAEPSLDVYADAVARVLDAVDRPRAVLAGVSLGGYVAMAFARRYPERVAGMALIDTKAEADSAEAAANRERIAQAVTGEAGNRALAPMIDSLLGETTRASRPELVERVRDLLSRAPVEGVAWAQRAMAVRPDSFETLRSLAVPAAVVVGDEDLLSPPEAAVAMAAALPDALLTIVPAAGHLTPLERPRAVTAALLALSLRVQASSVG
jgi:pimeloyl-ACP methyl ester carboxylesterase